jgi:hypothetical protein
MTNTEAGPSAGTEPVRTAATREVSPAARKFAEYLARRMAPMIESAAKRNETTQQANDAVAIHTQTKRG